MKKVKYFIVMIMIAMAGMFTFSSCNSCSKATDEQQITEDVVVEAVLNVENTVSLDRQTMYMQYAEDYRWFETCIVLQDWLDEEQSVEAPVVTAVSNIFQYVEDRENGSFDTYVTLFAHTPDTTAVEVKSFAFWVGDMPLNEADITLTFSDAYTRLMEANVVKPHSQKVVLRRELGPKVCNAQYIFGNTRSQVYVDAVDGTVCTENPVYEGFTELTTPLGEWP